MLIYVVDDKATERDNLTRLLRAQSHEVIAFSNAVEILDYIADHPLPDLAIIDYQLGVAPNGVSLARQIRLMHPTIALVIISEYATKEIVVSAFRNGIDDFILRPAEDEVMLDVIGEIILRRRHAAQLSTTNYTESTLKLDHDMRRAYWHGVELKLTPTEYSLLSQLVAHPNVALNFADINSAINGDHLSSQHARRRLKSQLSNLRNKLRAAAPDFPVPIHNSWGHGAYWKADDSGSSS
jgi:DNA-binding response OmpR family regulator